MATATGDAAINFSQPTDGSNQNSNPEHAGANAKFFDSAYGARGEQSQPPADGAAPGDGQKNSVSPDVLKYLTSKKDDGMKQWLGGDLQVTRTEPGMPERLPTGDTEIHEKDRDIIVMPKDEGSLTINKDGSFDLQLNKHSKEKAEITQKDGVTTITFQPSGDKIQFDKDGLLDINRGNQGVTWLRFDGPTLQFPQFPGNGGIDFGNHGPAEPGSGDRQPVLPPPAHPLPGDANPGHGGPPAKQVPSDHLGDPSQATTDP